MKKSEFNKVDWDSCEFVRYKNIIYKVFGVNEQEKLIGLDVNPYDVDIEPVWVRCENVELIK